ncbi:MAG: HAD-IB family hydrolase [Patescibacteria group bacterium]
MKKVVVFFDVDGTLLRGNINTAILLYLFRKGELPIVMILRSLFWYMSWHLGFTNNVAHIARKGAQELAGISEGHLKDLVDNAFDQEVAKNIYKEAVAIIKDHWDKGHEVILLSSSFEPFIKKVAMHLNIPEVIATNLEVTGGKYTGRIHGEVVWGNKHHIVEEFCRAQKPDEIYAYTDQFQDASMLELVTYPVAVNPDFRLRRRARTRGWMILNFY